MHIMLVVAENQIQMNVTHGSVSSAGDGVNVKVHKISLVVINLSNTA